MIGTDDPDEYIDVMDVQMFIIILASTFFLILDSMIFLMIYSSISLGI